MKLKVVPLLPGVLALMLAAAPMIPVFTPSAIAGTAHSGKDGMKRDGMKKLNLTDAQKAQLKEIRESTRKEMDGVLTAEQKEKMRVAKQNRQRPNLNLSTEQKAKMKEIRERAKSRMDGVLTAEQKQQMQQMRQQRQQQRQQQQPQQQ